jgi:hypothetical protein
MIESPAADSAISSGFSDCEVELREKVESSMGELVEPLWACRSRL